MWNVETGECINQLLFASSPPSSDASISMYWCSLLASPTLDLCLLSHGPLLHLRVRGSLPIARITLPSSPLARFPLPDLSGVLSFLSDGSLMWSSTAVLQRKALYCGEAAAAEEGLRRGVHAVESALESAKGAWETVREAWESAVRKGLRKRLDEMGETTEVADALLDIMLCGTNIGGTLSWLENDIGEKGAAKLNKVIQESFKTIDATFTGTVVEAAKNMALRSQELLSMVESKDKLGGEVCRDSAPFKEFARHCSVLSSLVQDFIPKSQELRKPLVSFSHWLIRTLKLLQYEECLNSSDEVRRKELEDELNNMRKTEPYDELEVAQCIMENDLSWMPEMMGMMMDSVQYARTLLSATLENLVVEVKDVQQVVQMPCEVMNGAAFYSDPQGEGGQMAIVRRDDIALVSWSKEEPLPNHSLNVYDIVDGYIVAAQYYKNGTLLVLSADDESEEKKSVLTFVENGEDVKSRSFPGIATHLSVSPNRGIAAVYCANQVHLLDLENDEDEEEGVAEEEAAGEEDVN